MIPIQGEPKDRPEPEREERWLLTSWMAVAGVAVTSAVPLVVYVVAVGGNGWSFDPEQWAHFATYVSGTVAVLISGFGLLALVATLRFQQLQFAQIAREAASRELESRLLQLLGTLSDIINETESRTAKGHRLLAKGRNAYKRLYKQKLKALYRLHKRDMGSVPEAAFVKFVFDRLYDRFGATFGHYFRTLYQCVRLIHTADLTVSQKQVQLDLVFCRLSKFELLLLMYNCLGSRGEVKFKPLVERYGLLEHLDRELLIRPSHVRLFEPSAWGKHSGELLMDKAPLQ